MPRVLTNDFSWSKSRHEKFSECLRAYYFHYYASWGGWDPRAPAAARTLYVLKKLGNRFSWAGTIVHDAIKDALLDWQAGRPVDAAQVEERAHRLMQNDFRHSRSKAYWSQKHRKAFAGLAEHEYDEALEPEAWKQNWETVRQALAWFFNSRWPALAKTLPAGRWLEVDAGFEHSHFMMEGVKVYAIPDFAYLEEDGTPVVVDWKTGRSREGYDLQVLGYALYLAQRYRVPVERVKTQLVYLNEGLEQEVAVDAAAVQTFQNHFQRSVAQMREVLAQPSSNTPKEESAFAQTSQPSACTRCVFRRPCGREAQASLLSGAA